MPKFPKVWDWDQKEFSWALGTNETQFAQVTPFIQRPVTVGHVFVRTIVRLGYDHASVGHMPVMQVAWALGTQQVSNPFVSGVPEGDVMLHDVLITQPGYFIQQTNAALAAFQGEATAIERLETKGMRRLETLDDQMHLSVRPGFALPNGVSLQVSVYVRALYMLPVF